MLKRTHGIVLKSSIFGEADLIVTYLTPHFGLLSAFAKSPRKIKSRFGSSLEPLTYSRISFFGKEEAALPRLTQSDIIKPFHSLRNDFNCLLKVSEILELCLNFLPKREPAPDIFRLLLHMMTTLESDADNKLLYLYYKMRFLHTIGYLPGLSVCGKCGSGALKNRENESVHFYITHGSVICNRCFIDDGYPGPTKSRETFRGDSSICMSHGALRFHESLLKWNPSALGRINAPKNLVEELTGVIDAHIRHVLGPSRFAGKSCTLQYRT
ncbi:MAG: DNA repair protein RecO [Nitrospirae bacterium]|nr:DNA repair protein RecO [Nitrospirota bacterium]